LPTPPADLANPGVPNRHRLRGHWPSLGGQPSPGWNHHRRSCTKRLSPPRHLGELGTIEL